MGKIKDAYDWLCKQVQKGTGEAERRELTQHIKELVADFKTKVSLAIDKLNNEINTFNSNIYKLNSVRQSTVKSNIQVLNAFLNKFGKCKSIGSYAPESDKLPAQFPQKSLEEKEKYIGNIDWSNEKVFWETFFLTPFGQKIRTRNHNLSLRESANELTLQTEETLNELRIKTFSTEKETEICKLYIENVKFISHIIQTKIIPELQLVEAFFEAEKLKQHIICNTGLSNIKFSYKLDLLKDTQYSKHYKFVKNAFMFYVISCTIYDTPVLTNLLNYKTTESDKKQLLLEKKVLEAQGNNVLKSMCVTR